MLWFFSRVISSMPYQGLILFVIIAWNIWKARNAFYYAFAGGEAKNERLVSGATRCRAALWCVDFYMISERIPWCMVVEYICKGDLSSSQHNFILLLYQELTMFYLFILLFIYNLSRCVKVHSIRLISEAKQWR